jgi:elongator complex protein 1
MVEIERRGEKPEGHFLLPILSTFAKENPPRVDEALSLIKAKALEQHPESSKANPLFSDKAQNSIHYLAFLAEYDLLFETALGMYDYALARGVARNSQMDPKVYLPLLKRLNALPTHYGRFEFALKNLFQSNLTDENIDGLQEEIYSKSSGNSFDSCMSVIEEHKLHRLGLELFQNDPDKRRVIFTSLGESLLKENRAEAALSIFLAADPADLEGAKCAARAACDWRCYFSLQIENKEDHEADEPSQSQEIRLEKRRQLARDVADEIVAGREASKTKQELHSDAARILLDYGNDLNGAVDILLSAECWSEGHRIARLHARQDFVKKCVDGSVSYAYQAMEEFEEKAVAFVAANIRYAEVLKLRKKNVQLEGPAAATEADETGSLFSAASNVSNMSLRSDTSASSTGSSLSSIISIKSTTTFTMTGDDDISNRHRSKFNKGKKQKKPRKKSRKERRKPGSEEELKGIVASLRAACAGADYMHTIAETIRFLIFVQQLPLASEVFKRYNAMRNVIEQSRTERLEVTKKEKAELERISRQEGENHDENHILVELPIEKEMDALTCAEFPESLRDFFSFT